MGCNTHAAVVVVVFEGPTSPERRSASNLSPLYEPVAPAIDHAGGEEGGGVVLSRISILRGDIKRDGHTYWRPWIILFSWRSQPDNPLPHPIASKSSLS